jgi:hypothetical protein
MRKRQQGFAHPFFLLILLIVIVIIGVTFYRVAHKPNDTQAASGNSQLGNRNSTDPVEKGKALSNGQCEGKGSSALTHAPMDINDIGTIEPMGLMLGGHVTPVDHEYYYGKKLDAALDTYPVYADGDGFVVAIMAAPNGDHQNWWVTIAHSCTFLTNYNLITNISQNLKNKLPADWGPNSNGGIKIQVKAGDIIGYVGGQSLDYQVWDTTKTLKGLLHPTAYNNAEPWKIHTVAPLDYFTTAVKNQILPKYALKSEPRDGKIDYDVEGQAVGSWFLAGSNGYLGTDGAKTSNYYKGHLSLAYFYLDPSVEEFSIGEYNGGDAMQFAVKDNTDWRKITPSSGLVKVELASPDPRTGQPGNTQATALLEMTGAETMKVEVFPGKSPSQVNGFTSNAKLYNRGQDAHMVESTTAH